MLNRFSVSFLISLVLLVTSSLPILASYSVLDLPALEDRIKIAIDNNDEQAFTLIESLFELEGYEPSLIEGTAFFYKGEQSYSAENWVEAIDFYSQAAQYFILSGDSAKLASAYNNIGLVYSFQGAFDRSLEFFSRSLEIELDLNNQLGIAKCYHNMAIVFGAGENYSRSLEFYSNALKIYEDKGEFTDAAAIYNNLATYYSKISDFDQAEFYYNKAVDIYKNNNMPGNEGRVLTNIGAMLLRKGDYSNGSKLLERALFLLKSNGDRVGEVNAYSVLGDIYVARGEFQQAIFLYRMSDKLAFELGLNDVRMKNLFSLYSTYKQLAQWQEALNIYETYTAIKDQLMAENEEFRTGKLGQELEQKIMERDSFIQKSSSRQKLLLFIVIIMFFATVAAITVASVRRRRIMKIKLLDEIKLQMAKRKNNPHSLVMIISSLRNSIVDGNTDKTLKHLDEVSCLTGKIVENAGEELIPLRQEIEFLNAYFDFKKRSLNKDVEINLETNLLKNADEVFIPSMLIMQFLEHAFNNGRFHHNDESIQINIAFMRKANFLDVTIEDNGRGLGNYKSADLQLFFKSTRECIVNDFLKNDKGSKHKGLFDDYFSEDRIVDGQRVGQRVKFNLPLMIS
jgi:tetratricopeptide (TPR) repeat protein